MLGYPKRPEYALKPNDETFKRLELEEPTDPRQALIYWEAASMRFRMTATYYSKVSMWWSCFSVAWATFSIALSLFNWSYV